MTERRGGLGRGLAALIPTGPPEPHDSRPGVGTRAADVVITTSAPASKYLITCSEVSTPVVAASDPLT